MIGNLQKRAQKTWGVLAQRWFDVFLVGSTATLVGIVLAALLMDVYVNRY